MRPAAAVALLTLLATTACSSSADDAGYGEVPAGPPASGASPSSSAPASSRPAPRRTAVPDLAVEVVASGFEHGWDIGFLPDGRALVTERPGRIALVSGLRAGATRTQVRADLSDLYVNSEGGLMGMVVHPDFATSREFTTCQTHQEGGTPVDIRLVTWRLSADGASATRVRDLLTGLPLSTGRHSGCRPTLDAGGALVVGTGDTAVGSLPQDLTSLGGKTLRLDLETGAPLPDNPFIGAANVKQRYVQTYGHRNVQGVALRPGTDQVFTAEHGPDNNDEVNLIRAGANYGWDPAQGGTVGGYDEGVPMTDTARYPDAVPAVWQSGRTTQAVCGLAFLEGPQWGAFDGALVVTALKGAKLLVLTLDDAGAVTDVAIPEATNGPYGRLRAARLGPDRALYVTTTNGDDDKLLRITPRT
ncbi:glucose dehydrogenase [Nostocoides sp. Soil756]|nr:glucose dehydrogenase [Tetrasphaera sp. Soil756]